MSSTQQIGVAAQVPVLSYRRDIDGLRAVAVLTVVAFHAFPTLLTGGYVGVDVFFVISGYLISGIIADRLREGRFSILGFYRQRIHRIFPALIAVLAACLIVGYAFLMSDEFRRVGMHTFCSALFSENIALWHESGYFVLNSGKKPLLHLWTLAIEEQFYILYPMLLVVLWRRGVRAIVGILALLMLSFATNAYFINEYPVATFFFIGSRAWELFAGGMLAFWEREIRPSPSSRRWDASRMIPILSWSGLALILASALWFDSSMSYPGFRAAAPVIGTLMVIAAGPQSLIAKHVLGNRLFVYVGLISYPLYLWHWPLLSFWSIVEPGDDTVSVKVTLILACFALSILTYHVLERHLRRNAARLSTVGLIGAVIIIAILGLLGWQGTIHQRHAVSAFDDMVHRATQDWSYPGSMTPVPMGDRSYYIAGGHGQRTLYWGDSHIQQYAPRIYDLVKDGKEGDRGVIFLADAGLPPLPGVRSQSRGEVERENEERFRLLARDTNVDSVVIGAEWGLYFRPASGFVVAVGDSRYRLDTSAGRELARVELEKLLSGLVKDGKRVYILQDNPNSQHFHPAYIYQRGFLDGGFALRSEGISRPDVLERSAFDRAFVRTIAAASGAQIIDPLEYLANGDVFPALSENGDPIYIDTNHLRASYVRAHIRYLDQTLDRPAP